jgi:hypothetical protein
MPLLFTSAAFDAAFLILAFLSWTIHPCIPNARVPCDKAAFALCREGFKAVKIFAKICTPVAVHNRKSIIEAADGVIVARGSLGLDLRPEKVFLAVKATLKTANMAGKVRCHCHRLPRIWL